MKIKLRNFDGGLVLTPPVDKIPQDALYYARGYGRLSRGGIQQRQGSTALHTVNTIEIGSRGIYYWNNTWFYGSSNSLYQGSTCISSGTYDGNRLTFAVAGPTAGMPDRLFIAGGSTDTLRKVDTSNTVTRWGIGPPPSLGVRATTGGTAGAMTSGVDYSYRFTYYNSETGTRSNPTTVPSTTAGTTATVLLIAATGAHGSTAAADAGPVGHTIVTTGNCVVSTGKDDPFSGDDGALYCPTSADIFYVAEHSDFGFSTAPFTIEFFAYLTDVSASLGFFQNFASTDDFYSLSWEQTGTRLKFHAEQGGFVRISRSATWNPSTGQWYHIAIVRGGSSPDSWGIFVDGVRLGGGADSGNVPAAPGANFEVGKGCYYWSSDASYSTGLPAKAYFSQFHVAKETLWSTDFTPSTSLRYGTAWLNATSNSITLTGLTPATDTQVTHTEVWRTAGDGETYYLVERIDKNDTTYTDITADLELGFDELPTDNLIPYNWFDDCVVYNASMFWITRTQSGEKGRVYYSPIGRLEVVEGFINVTDDAEPLQKLVKYGAGLGVFSNGGFYEILGENPYYARPIPGIPGTIEPFSVAITPYGVAYEAADGPRMLIGGGTKPLAEGTLDAVFQGQALGQLSAWGTGTWATYARGEYILCDTTNFQTVAIDLRSGRCRDLGLALGSIYYSAQTDQIAANVPASSAVWEVENEGSYDDNGTAIATALQTMTFTHPSQQEVLVRNVFADFETSRSVTFGLQYDNGSTKDIVESTVATSTRRVAVLPYNTWTRDFALRVTPSGSSTGNFKLHGIDFDIYIPQEEAE